MKKINIYVLIVLLSTIGAQVVTVQGVLRDNNNAAISDGTYEMTFEIFDSQSGGTSLWSTVGEDVTVINGVYSLGLNIGTTLQSSGSELWLEVTVNGDTMNERVRLHISPYEQTILTGQSNIFPGAGSVGIGTTDPDPSTKLDVRGDVSTTGTVSANAFQGDGSALTGIDPGNISAGDVNFNNITATGTVDMDGTLTIQDKIKFDSNADYSTMNIYNESLETDISTIYFFGRDISGDLDNVQVILKNSEQSGTIRLNSETGEIFSLTTNFNNSIDANDLGEDVVGDSELSPGVKSVKNFSVLCYGGDDSSTHCVNSENWIGCGEEGGIVVVSGQSGLMQLEFAYIMAFAQWPNNGSYVEVAREVISSGTADYITNVSSLTIPCIPETQVYITFDNIAVTSSQTRITYWYY